MRTALAVCAALACGPSVAASVEVQVEGIEPGAGIVYVALCQDGLGEAECRSGQEIPAEGRTRRVVLGGIAPGTYAVAAYQDLNGNHRLDRTGLGLPLEPYGFSGDTGRTRPDFTRARFTLREPGIAVRVRLVRALPPR